MAKVVVVFVDVREGEAIYTQDGRKEGTAIWMSEGWDPTVVSSNLIQTENKLIQKRK